MRDVPGMKYQVVAEYGAWPVRRERIGPLVDRWDDAMRICATVAQEAGRPSKLIVLYAMDEQDIDQMFDRIRQGGMAASSVTPAQEEVERRKLEDGQGGDHDVPYEFNLPSWQPTTMKWVELLADVEGGVLGGADDGSDPFGSPTE